MNAILRSLSVVVGIPTLVAAIYYGLFASDIYVSEAKVAIRSAKATTSVSGIAAILGTSVGGGGAQNTMVVADYARSLDMLKRVRERIDINAHYGSDEIDFLSRLDSEPTNEELQSYFRQHVEFLRDSASDVLTLRVRAFDREVAQDLAKLVIELSEELVNTLSTRIEEDALESAQKEMAIATEKVRQASAEMTRFQNTNLSLNPAAESSAILGMVTGIESMLIEARAELTEKRAYMRDSSAEVVSLKNRVNALSRQLRLEKGRVVGNTGQGEMNGLIESFQPLVLEQEMAQQQYASALASLEIARIEALRKKQYLITFIQPSLPDQALEPHRIKEVLTVMVFSFLFYIIGGLLWSALKDHMGQ